MSRPHRTAVGITELSMRGQDKARFGCIVTAREKTTGELRTFHESDSVLKAVKAICERIDKLEGSWKIICISTPSTIYRDLQGTRRNVLGRFHRSGVPYRQVTFHPLERERQLLSRAGRRDLLADDVLPMPPVYLEPRRWTRLNRGQNE